MRNLVITLFIAMLVLHQDAWNWGDESVLFGFMPVALAYHAVFALCCAALGYLAVRYLWPHQMERNAEAPSEP